MMLSHFFPIASSAHHYFRIHSGSQTLMAMRITMDCMLKVQIPGAQAQKFHLAYEEPRYLSFLTCNQEVFKELVH